MIILQGPDEKMRQELFKKLTPYMEHQYQTPETARADMRYLVNQVHLSRNYLRDQFLHEQPEGPNRYMLGMALAASGALIVFCGEATRESVSYATMGGLVPVIPINGYWETDQAVGIIMDAWRDQQKIVDPLYECFGSGGVHFGEAVMLVGEANQEIGDIKRRAFINHQGCSLYLHEALWKNKQNRYYLTNARKSENVKYNQAAIIQEIELINPRKIVALGAEAAKMLSDLRLNFTRTWHPSYWMRFKYNDISELIDVVK